MKTGIGEISGVANISLFSRYLLRFTGYLRFKFIILSKLIIIVLGVGVYEAEGRVGEERARETCRGVPYFVIIQKILIYVSS